MPALTRWHPFRQMGGEMERLFSCLPSFGRETAWLPAVDVEQTKDALVITFDLPGMTRDDVTVELHDRMLTVSGVRTTLPDAVKPDDIDARVANGELRIPVRRPERAIPQRIFIAADA